MPAKAGKGKKSNPKKKKSNVYNEADKAVGRFVRTGRAKKPKRNTGTTKAKPSYSRSKKTIKTRSK
jgi:hypothetical protein